jgi:uncharacterized cupin superfamily protein
MTEQGLPFPLLSAEAIEAMQERTHRHAYNPNGVRQTRALGDATGLTQIGVHLVRVEPGKDSTEFHTHAHDEEWIYILSGCGIAEIGERRVPVKAGDFMGFAVACPPHSLSNDSAEDLVYLLGGTRHAYDVVDYPRRGVRSYKYDGKRDNVEVRTLAGGK